MQNQAIGALNAQAAIWKASRFSLASAFMSYYAQGGGYVDKGSGYLMTPLQLQTLKQELAHTSQWQSGIEQSLQNNYSNIKANTWVPVTESPSTVIHLQYSGENSDLGYAFGSVDLKYSGMIYKDSTGSFLYSLTFSVHKEYRFSLDSLNHIYTWLAYPVFADGTYLQDI